MLVFLDTEFTDFARPELISLALVAEDGQEFYAERTDYRLDDCSEFVRKEVLPVLHRVSGSSCDRKQLTNRLHDWFQKLPEPATLIFDYEGDWLLLVSALLDVTHKKPPPNVGDKLHLDSRTIAHPVFDQAKNFIYTQQWPPHHALSDARALMAGYRAWKSHTEPSSITDSELLKNVTQALVASRRPEKPGSDEVHLWIETPDTGTGQSTWQRRDLFEEWNRLQLKIRGIC